MLDGNYTYGGIAHRAGYLRSMGINYMAPPVGQLITRNGTSGIAASPYVSTVQGAGMSIITWTVERNYACWPAPSAMRSDANVTACASFNELELIGTLHRMGVVGVFSDWPATTTFYASCIDHLAASRPTAATCREARDLFQGSGCCMANLDQQLTATSN
jgi:glycerophosphoryl diester phosphodiesterase